MGKTFGCMLTLLSSWRCITIETSDPCARAVSGRSRRGAAEAPYERYRRFHAISEQHRQQARQERVDRELRKQTRLMEEQARRERRAEKRGDHSSERRKEYFDTKCGDWLDSYADSGGRRTTMTKEGD